MGIVQMIGDQARKGALAAGGRSIDGDDVFICHASLLLNRSGTIAKPSYWLDKRFMRVRATIFSLCLFLAACAGQGISLIPYQDSGASPQHFRLCHGFSCSERTNVSLSDAQWNKVLSPFKKKAKNAEFERKQIADALSLMEKEVIADTGMKSDFGEARTFEGDQSQMDCVDEAINTSLYLKFLDQAGVLKFHKAAEPVHRGFFVDGQWPHNSGAVEEIATGEKYVIDSYYFDSGVPPAVVPLDVWLAEWRPENLPDKDVKQH